MRNKNLVIVDTLHTHTHTHTHLCNLKKKRGVKYDTSK